MSFCANCMKMMSFTGGGKLSRKRAVPLGFCSFVLANALVAAEYTWSPEKGGCVMGEGPDAVTVSVSGGAVSFVGSRPGLSYLGRYLPKEETGKWQTVLSGVSLADVEVYSTRYYNPSAHPGVTVGQAIDGVAFPGMVEYHDDASVSMVLMRYDGVYTKGVKIRLRQNGSDIEGQAVWAKYATGDFVGSEMDFSQSKWREMNVADEETATNSYGVDQLTFVPRWGCAVRTGVEVAALPPEISSLSVSGGVELTVKNGALNGAGGAMPAAVSVSDAGLVVEAGESAVTVGSAFSGVNGDITFVCADEAEAPDGYSFRTNMLFTTRFEDCIIPGARLSCVTSAVAWMAGSNLSAPSGYHSPGFFFENDGHTASCQFQMKGGDYIKCVLLEMKQVGNDIHVKTPHARYINFTSPEFVQYAGIGLFRFTAYNGSGGATVTDGAGYCITNLVLSGCEQPYCVNLSGSCANDSELHFSFRGNGRRPLLAEVTASAALPQNDKVRVDVDAGSTLLLNKATAGSVIYRIRDGGLLDNGVNWSVNPYQSIFLEGGRVHFGGNGALTYARKIVYRDGAVSDGTELRFGNGTSGYVGAFGSKPSFADMNFGLFSKDARTYTFSIDDVTSSAETDFTVMGSIFHCGTAADTHSTIVKTGAGTMRWNGVCSAVGEPILLQEGTLLLGASGILAAGHRLALSGGNLAAASGTANGCRSFALEKDATFDIGEGASLSFDEIASWDDDAKLQIVAGKDAGLRIGTSAVLTGAQLSRIRMNGVRVLQDAAGNVTMRPDSLFMVVR